ncbi:GNAT family N-acetyltransferase [Streptomyces sp. 1222.5]|uniref:GNAT family N-acetyltransferase n=1 Tax=Streptomyces sp. 1222.5 TaxID=1881026 RepID=UPI003EBB8DC2
MQVAKFRAADAQFTSGKRVRLMESADHGAVLSLIDDDRLPGQPATDPELIAGPAREGLAEMVTLVLADAADSIVGVVSSAVRVSDATCLIGWLHGREDFEVLATLIAAARARFSLSRTLHAGTGAAQPAQAVAFGMPGIAERRRPAATRALRAAGFTPATSRIYFHRPLTPPPARPVFPLADLQSLSDPAGMQLTLVETDGHPQATAVMHIKDDHWLLSHLAVRPDRRGRGIGSHLLALCLHTAHTRGATSLIAHINVDDRASTQLLTSAGFTALDLLTVYHRRP